VLHGKSGTAAQSRADVRKLLHVHLELPGFLTSYSTTASFGAQ
jgi:hypothetical protein